MLKRVLSGIQPSGTIHLGNYFGAIKQFLELQESSECYIFIANYHALTTIKDGNLLRQNTFDVALNYLASGLDPDKVSIFRQSDVPEVCELSWILSTLTPMGLLERCHSFKDKTARGIAADHGLFAYPVLMAADILIYGSDIVPVGKDQIQHVEVARDIAIKFNNQYGEVFKVPELKVNQSTATVPGVDGQKMSKSYDNFISQFWDEKQLKKKISQIVTDSTPLEDPKNPDTCSVFALYSLMATPEQRNSLREKYLAGNFGYGHAKKELLDMILSYFDKSRSRYEKLKNNPEFVESILAQGALRARESAQKIMDRVRNVVGL